MLTKVTYNLHLKNITIDKTGKVVALSISALLIFFVTTACASETESMPGNIQTNTATPIQALSSIITPTSASLVLPNSMPKDWQSRWLKGIPCRPPCWEGIIPGQTNELEALRLLEQNLLIKSGTLRSLPASPGETYGGIGWKWQVEEPSSATPIGRGRQIFYDATPNRIVDHIRPGLSGYKLSDVIQSYGEPSHVTGTDETNPEGYPLNLVVRFVYLNQGFLVESRSGDNPLVLSKDMAVDNPRFFKPDLAGFTAIKFPPPRYLMPWQGYKPFSFYCRELTVEDRLCLRAK